jgi:hypothetical protein
LESLLIEVEVLEKQKKKKKKRAKWEGIMQKPLLIFYTDYIQL